MERKTFSITDFSGGEQSSMSPERIAPNGAIIAKNGLIDIDASFYKRNLASLIATAGTSTATVINHCEYNKSSGLKYHLVAYSDGRVYYYKEGTDVQFTEITGFATDFGDTADVNMLSYSDLVWFIDGKYAYTWDGSTLTRVDSGGAGALWASDFDDAKYIAQAHGLIYMAGYTADPAAVMYSRYTDDDGLYINPNDTDAWVATNIFKIPQEGQIVVGLFGYKSELLIFTQDKVWVLTGDIASTNSVLRELYSYAGCFDNKSIAEVRGAVHWVGRGGVYRYNGSGIEIISMAIKDYFEWIQYATQYTRWFNYDTEVQFESFTGTNDSIEDVSGSIVPTCEPAVGSPEQYANTKILNDDTASTRYDKLATEFQVSHSISGNATIRFHCKKLSKTESLTVRICTNLADVSGSTISNGSATMTKIGMASYSPTYYTGYSYASFTSIALTIGTQYYIVIENTYGNIEMYAVSNWDFTGDIYGITHGSSSFTELTDFSGYQMTALFYPAQMIVVTDVWACENVQTMGKIAVELDSDYEDSTTTLEYRYSKVSAADCITQSWVSTTNNDYPTFSFSAGDEIWVQFRITSTTTNPAQSGSNNPWAIICPKIDSVSFYYTSSTAETLRIYGTQFENRYYLSIPELGKSTNQKVLVLNLNDAWTWFDLETNCMWEQDKYLTYGLSDTNQIYQLTDKTGEVSDEWTSEENWEDYEQDDSCDDDTVAGSLQTLAGTSDDLVVNADVSDDFSDGSVDEKWTQEGDVNWSETGGLITSTVSPTTEVDADLWQAVTNATDCEMTVKFGLAGMSTSTTAYAGFTFCDLDTDNTILAAIERLSGDFVRVNAQQIVGGSQTDNRTDSLEKPAYMWLKIERTIGETNDTHIVSYSLDGAIYTIVHTYTDTPTSDNLSLRIKNRKGATAAVSTITADDFVFKDDTGYKDGAFRIYRYNSTGDATIYWEASNADASNSITLYYARGRKSAVPDEATVDQTYDWTEIDTIESANLTGNSAFTTTAYKYIKVVFNNTDTTDTASLQRLYIVTDEAIEMIWESPYLELGAADMEKYLRKIHPDIESEGNVDFYYKTEKMTDYRHYEVAGTDKRISTAAEHGQKIKVKVVSDNALACRYKHITIDYKERLLR